MVKSTRIVAESSAVYGLEDMDKVANVLHLSTENLGGGQDMTICRNRKEKCEIMKEHAFRFKKGDDLKLSIEKYNSRNYINRVRNIFF